jgi:uncharacterized membrane protein (UPF0127 family)
MKKSTPFCRKHLIRCFAFLALAVAAACVASAATSDSSAKLSSLAISGPVHATVHFWVEVAETQGDKERGLMGRQVLPADRGMVFPYETPQTVAFWMKDTPLPLDLIFIDASHRIAAIHPQAQPYDLTPISSVVPVVMVLEVNGGAAARLGLKSGDFVSWEIRGEQEHSADDTGLSLAR